DDCAIRWGIDAQHRARLGLPAFAENSWRHGLDRMLLGCALRPEKRELFDGILPFDEIEGSSAELLGNFVEFLERLFSRAIEFSKPRSLSEWQRDLRETLDAFFAPEETAQMELNRLRNAIAALGEIGATSQNESAVPLDVVVAQLEHSLEESSTGAGFLSGQLTFCALKPMRSIPFKVVCLLGLNDTAYPRHDRAPGFDLVAQHPKRGDRNIRDGDRPLVQLLGRQLRGGNGLGKGPKGGASLLRSTTERTGKGMARSGNCTASRVFFSSRKIFCAAKAGNRIATPTR